MPFKFSKNQPPRRARRLFYTNGGDAILVLASNGIHFLWKWPQDLNFSGVATPKVHPNLWKPRSGLELMNNDFTIEPAYFTIDFKKDKVLFENSAS
ncbi:unnamed protein product [Prunus armeniaca]